MAKVRIFDYISAEKGEETFSIAETLFGNYNPGGRLPVAFPRSILGAFSEENSRYRFRETGCYPPGNVVGPVGNFGDAEAVGNGTGSVPVYAVHV